MLRKTLDLTGRWEFREYPVSARRIRDLDEGQWHQTTVPSSIFISLIEAGKIDRRDVDTNPEDFQWVSEKAWIFRKVFDACDEIIESGRVDLVFDGLDTVASIWLNDKLIGKSCNMFVGHRFDVTSLVKQRDNCLMVKFDPAAEHAKKLMDRYTTFSESDFRNPYRVYIRKAQYQFGWDWGPELAGCGIWRAVRLEPVTKGRLADVHVRTVDCTSEYADVRVGVKLDRLAGGDLVCRLKVVRGGQIIQQDMNFKGGEDFHSTLIRVDRPAMWWPAGYGEQHFYELSAELLSGDEVLDEQRKRFGIRTVRLNRSVDKYGEEFQFEVNGQSVYARGTNWIPASIYAGSVTRDDYRELLVAAKKANMNMLRVWGGGYYEDERFYELCDELGILVWQDFMFACAYYPDRQWFLDQVKAEATDVVTRLRNHPCIALWCGNNEIDWMHSKGVMGKSRKFHGKVIYHKLLPGLLSQLDPDRDYIPTTPVGKGKEPNDAKSGSVHQWEMWSGYTPVQDYQCEAEKVPRFVAEFGFQGLPNIETIKEFCPAEQLRTGSECIEKHNYQLDGNGRLYLYTGELFGSAGDIDRFVYLSQVAQGRAVKRYVEHLRVHNYRNSGVLFWQLNDCCPAISWSAIDHMKRPKALYYYARRFFASQMVAIVPQMEKTRCGRPPKLQAVGAVVINDSSKPLTATLGCRMVDLGGKVLDDVEFPVTCGPFSRIAELKLPKAFACPAKAERTVMYCVLENDERKIAENLFLYQPDKYMQWPKTEIAWDAEKVSDEQWKIRLRSEVVAKDVQFSSSVPMRFSDNFIDIIGPDEVEVIVNCEQQLDSLDSVLSVRSIGGVLS